MVPDASKAADDLHLKNHQKYKILFYSVSGDEAFEAGDFETAEELYRRAIEEIGVYKDNIADIMDRATLDEEDLRNLEAMEDELDDLEEGIEEQLNALL